jgi:hypothetical protein
MAMGRDVGQGDLISPPRSHAQFLDLLRQRSGKPRAQPQGTDAPAASVPPMPVAPIDRVA